MFEILFVPLIACVVLTGIHCYLGIHVLMRQVIFVDLALAQIAAMGASVGVALGYEPRSLPGYLFSLGSTLVGAAIFSISRFRDRRVPTEAIIGIVYAVSSAVTILLVSQTAAERDHIEHMLVGRLLFVEWGEVVIMAVIYAVVGLLHLLCRHPFYRITIAKAGDSPGHARVVMWDFLFYATFGVVITSSVKAAGVLLVFSYLIVPAACAMIYFNTIRSRLFAGWTFGLAASGVGLAISAWWDLPTGAAIVAVFGALFMSCVLIYALANQLRSRNVATV